MKNPKLILNYLVFFVVLGSFFYYKEIYLKKQAQSKLTTESTIETINNDSNVESTTVCNICGNEFYGNGYEEQSNGSFKELEYPYSNQICSPKCGRKQVQNINRVARKYGVDLDEQNSESNSNTQGDYRKDNDRRVYEKNNCSLCKGTGVEKGRNMATGESQSRICPMCEGRGVRSY
jgi:hypothetical protein